MSRKPGVVKETTEKTVKKLPPSENGPGVLCTTTTGQKYQISQNIERMRFTLWSLSHGTSEYGAIDELDKSPASQAGGCGFDPHWHHHTVRWTNW